MIADLLLALYTLHRAARARTPGELRAAMADLGVSTRDMGEHIIRQYPEHWALLARVSAERSTALLLCPRHYPAAPARAPPQAVLAAAHAILARRPDALELVFAADRPWTLY
jgi:hypothetical protein